MIPSLLAENSSHLCLPNSVSNFYLASVNRESQDVGQQQWVWAGELRSKWVTMDMEWWAWPEGVGVGGEEVPRQDGVRG